MSSDFRASKKRGDLGQALFFQAHPGHFKEEDGRERDFTEVGTGWGVELKTDFYDMGSTRCFFFERFSNAEKGTPGGPWQALSHGNKWFVYFFVQNMTYYVFDTEALVTRLESLESGLRMTDVRNRTHITQGYKVERDGLSDIFARRSIALSVKEK